MQENNNIVNHLRLIIRISRNSLAFASVNSENEGQISFEPYLLHSGISMAANLREAFRSQEMLQRKYARVLVMIDSPTLMVPLEMFHEEEQRTLYLHTYQGHEQDEITHTVLPDLNCVAVFSVNRDQKLVLDDHFEQLTFIAAIAPVWRYLHQRSYMGVRDKLYAYFHEHHMEVFSYGQNRFKFCNTFEARDAHDALYYLLYIWKQIALLADRDEIHLVGDIPEREWLMTELQKYIKRVYAINPAGDFNRSAVTQIEGMSYDLMTLFVKGR
ncbi:MAG: DUF3822 family protein [Paludibacteraceae bacterium]|nr:DUF3822 family protein [Prevotella sp.]MBQ8706220.1 DUF3822 family protein [Paludibacteraceae bacterium]MBQ8715278.1 DUF3822 family protein [Prevotella sp.]